MIINKIIAYFKSGGIWEVLGYALTYFKKLIYYKSITVFLYYDYSKQYYDDKINLDKIIFHTINSLNEIEMIPFKRLKTTDYYNWIKSGSVVFVGYYNDKPISFTWSHYGEHYLTGLGKVKLNNDKCWLGPTFVDKSYRGLGINKKQILYQIYHESKNIKYILTSANINNKSSIKSFERLGFVVGLTVSKYFGLFTPRKVEKKYENNGKDIINII